MVSGKAKTVYDIFQWLIDEMGPSPRASKNDHAHMAVEKVP